MGSQDNNEDFEFPVVEEAKISMALSEAEMSNSDLYFFSVQGQVGKPGLISQALLKWLSVSRSGHGGAFTVVIKDHPMLSAFSRHKNFSAFRVDDSLQTREFQEILLIGKDIAVCDVGGRIVINRNDQAFVGAARRVMSKLMSITKTLEQQK